MSLPIPFALLVYFSFLPVPLHSNYTLTIRWRLRYGTASDCSTESLVILERNLTTVVRTGLSLFISYYSGFCGMGLSSCDDVAVVLDSCSVEGKEQNTSSVVVNVTIADVP